MKNGYLYIAKSGEFYKIGRSKDPAQRVRNMRTSSVEPVVLVYDVEVKDVRETEKSVHEHFEQWSVPGKGEWYELNEKKLEAVKSYLLNHPKRIN